MARAQRRYTKRTKLATTMAAEISGVVQAAEATGIPHQTISYWMNDPELGEIRRKTREDLADEIRTVAHLAWQRVADTIRDGSMEPRDAIFAAEKATSLQILMTGGATARTENRDITGTISDADLLAAISEAESIAVGGGTAQEDTDPPEG
jgi:DhnA family fructose-bisphosphate aldolase class Ia